MTLGGGSGFKALRAQPAAQGSPSATATTTPAARPEAMVPGGPLTFPGPAPAALASPRASPAFPGAPPQPGSPRPDREDGATSAEVAEALNQHHEFSRGLLQNLVQGPQLKRTRSSVGERVYLVDHGWWEKFSASASASASPPDARRAALPPLTNQGLLLEDGATLKPNLVENFDYAVVDESAWSIIKAYWLRGPEIMRLTQSDGKVELYPIRLRARRLTRDNMGSLRAADAAKADLWLEDLSREARVTDLAMRARASFRLSERDAALFVGSAPVDDPSAPVVWLALDLSDERATLAQLGWSQDNCRARVLGVEDRTSAPISDLCAAMSDATVSASSAAAAATNSGAGAAQSLSLAIVPVSGVAASAPQRDEGDGRGSGKRDGLTGLRNLGNTCYMNAALQCLSHTQPLTALFLNKRWERYVNPGNKLGFKGEVPSTYSQLLAMLWSGKHNAVSPHGFKGGLDRWTSTFRGWRQHDSQELLSFVLDALHEDLKVAAPAAPAPASGDASAPAPAPADAAASPQVDAAAAAAAAAATTTSTSSDAAEAQRSAGDAALPPGSSLINQLFSGQLTSSLTCPACGFVSKTSEPYRLLSLELPAPAAAGPAPAPAPAPLATSAAASGGAGAAPNQPPLLLASATIVELAEDGSWAVPAARPVSWLVYGTSKAFVLAKLCRAPGGPEEAKSLDVVARLVGSVAERITALTRSRVEAKDLFAFQCAAAYPPTPSVVVVSRLSPNRLVGPPLLLTDVPAKMSHRELHDLVRRRVGHSALAEDGTPAYVLRRVRRLAEEGYEVPADDSMVQHVAMLASTLVLDWKGNPLAGPVAAPSQGAGESAPPASPMEIGPQLPEVGPQPNPAGAAGAGPSASGSASGSGSGSGSGGEAAAAAPAAPSPGAEPASGAPPSGAYSLYDCLAAFTAPEVLSEHDMWTCPRCEAPRAATKRIHVDSVPEVLLVHLKRFTAAGSKLTTAVEYPLELRLPEHGIYDLYGVVRHHGYSPAGGHYDAVVRVACDRTWRVFNDSLVSGPVPQPSTKDDAAYVLFYRKRLYRSKSELVQAAARELMRRGSQASVSASASASASTASSQRALM